MIKSKRPFTVCQQSNLWDIVLGVIILSVKFNAISLFSRFIYFRKSWHAKRCTMNWQYVISYSHTRPAKILYESILWKSLLNMLTWDQKGKWQQALNCFSGNKFSVLYLQVYFSIRNNTITVNKEGLDLPWK